jgi:cell fate regulator YaaT (PSP1 superfamily)
MDITPESERVNPADTVGQRETARPEGASRGPLTTTVRYGAMNWVGEFSYRPGTVTRCGASVVVQTDRGIELGRQLELCCASSPHAVSAEQIRRYVDNSGPEFCWLNAGRILREASGQDIDEHQRLNAHVKDDLAQCAALATELSLDVKVITAEHLLGGERIVFYFQAEGRIDFRELVKELARRYRTRIEMRQVGARDEARLVADWEVCGRECCCKNFLKSLRSVNMKMAKLQKSTLDPSKVSGRCGRLRCCLRYEHEGYHELAAKLPRKGSRVGTDYGEGTVVDHQILTQLVVVRTDDERDFVVPLEEIQAFDLPKPPPRKLPTPEDKAEPGVRPADGRPLDQGRRDRRRPPPPRRGERGVAATPAEELAPLDDEDAAASATAPVPEAQPDESVTPRASLDLPPALARTNVPGGTGSLLPVSAGPGPESSAPTDDTAGLSASSATRRRARRRRHRRKPNPGEPPPSREE